MSPLVQKRSVMARTPPMLAVLPDLSGHEEEELAQTDDTPRPPRKAVAPTRPDTLPRAELPHWSMGSVVIVSLFMAILLLITWKIVDRTQSTPTDSPLKSSYMTRFASPPQQTSDDMGTPINQP